MSPIGVACARRLRTAWPLAIIVILVVLALAPLQALAQEGNTPVSPYIVTLQAGESVQIPVYGFCLDYGLPFPNPTLDPIELASDPLRNAAIYSLETDYVNSATWDTQKAIWYLSDGTRLEGQDYTIADEIVAYANSGVQPADVVEGVPQMVDVIQGGALQAQVVDFVNLAEDLGTFFGGGTLVITNTSTTQQSFVVSYGSVGYDALEGDQQNMLVFPSELAPEKVAPAVPEVTEVPETGAFLPPAGFGALALIGAGLATFTGGRIRRRLRKTE